jgi:DNA adenine methylase
MTQPALFTPPRDKAINIATVPHRSPFRYPGGKTWLVPYIRAWLFAKPESPDMLIEPFAGGGIVGLTVAAERLAKHVLLVELDDDVAAVWQTMLEGDADWLVTKITSFEVAPESVRSVLAKTGSHALPATSRTRAEKAFQTILKNRVNRGGILAPGAGLVKTGENGKGLASRWYPETLKKRILAIVAMRDRLRFIHGDGIQVMEQNAHRKNAVFFVDPPYTAGGKNAGSRLYTHWQLDHEELFRVTNTLAGDFLMTYEDADEVRDLAAKHGFDTEVIAMKTTHHAHLSELLIGPDLSWVRR